MKARALPLLAVLLSVNSYQLGAVFAKRLFPLIGPESSTALRLLFAAIILAAVWRPWRGVRLKRGQVFVIVVYGVTLGLLNLFFYMAIRTIPLGIAVALQFLGPLAVAVLGSHRGADLLWIGLAGIGVVLLLPPEQIGTALDWSGLGYALLAALAWAAYIIFGQKAGQGLHGGRVTALGVAAGALAVVPFGVSQARGDMLSAAVLLPALGVAVLSSALPNSLEMFALKRIPVRVYGILMSLEPALAALYGRWMLHEHLVQRQWWGIVCVIVASMAISLLSRRSVDSDGLHQPAV